jgi:hypothetical protein
MAYSPEDFYGGPGVYNPAMGLLLVQHPELAAMHLASMGHEPPGDVPEGVDHVDAKQSLGKALAFNTRQGNPFDEGEQIMPQSALPLVNGDRFQNMPNPIEPPDPNNPLHMRDADVLSPPSVPAPTPRPTPPNPLAPPTPAPESSAATGTTPGPNTQTTPGQDVPLPRPRPTASASDGTQSAGVEEPVPQSGADKGKKQPLDDLALALSGLKGMPYSNPLHIYSPQAPRPSNMIARSTVPATLMGELAAAGHPSGTFRLGEALRGRAGA